MALDLNHQLDQITPTTSILTIGGTGGLTVPNGNNSSQQPITTGNNGLMRYDSTDNVLQAVVNGAYVNLATSADLANYLLKTGDTMSGVLGLTVGSAAAPALVFLGNATTGLFCPGSSLFGIATAGVERFRIDNTGRVGIGTTSPTTYLTVSSNALQLPTVTTPTGSVINIGSADGNNTAVTMYSFGSSNTIRAIRADGTNSVPSNLNTDDNILALSAWGYGQTSYSTSSRASIRLNAAETWSDASQGTYIAFFTTRKASITSTEKVRISDAGLIGVGTVTPQVSLDMGSVTDAILLPVGTTTSRPSGIPGMVRYNSQTNAVEAFLTGSPSVWTSLLAASNNLSDVTSAAQARTNLGLGTAATLNTTSFLQSANNLSDVTSQITARLNLQLNFGSNISTSSTQVTLTNPIASVQNVTMTATGQSVILPAMNTTISLIAGRVLFINNVGTNAFQILLQDGSTTLVSSLSSNQTAMLQVVSNATANGSWEVTTFASGSFLLSSNNLSDCTDTLQARSHIGCGTAATHNDTDFCKTSNNFSDVNNAAQCRTNLGCGTASTQSASTFLQAANNLSDVGNASTALTNLGAAALASPAFTGVPTGPTAASGTSTGQLATTQFVQTALSAAPGSPSGFKNLKVVNGGTPNNQMTVTADAITLANNSGNYFTTTTVSVTPDVTTTGANGLDTGAVAANSWYAIWVIYNTSGSTTAGLFSLSGTSPTMPSGYSYKARIGWALTDGSKHFYRIIQYGRKARYVVTTSTNTPNLPVLASGVTGSVSTPTYTSVSTATWVPTTAASITLAFPEVSGSGMDLIVAPNNAYGAITSTTNPPPMKIAYSSAQASGSGPAEIVLETVNIFWACDNGSGALFVMGWEDNI